MGGVIHVRKTWLELVLAGVTRAIQYSGALLREFRYSVTRVRLDQRRTFRSRVDILPVPRADFRQVVLDIETSGPVRYRIFSPVDPAESLCDGTVYRKTRRAGMTINSVLHLQASIPLRVEVSSMTKFVLHGVLPEYRVSELALRQYVQSTGRECSVSQEEAQEFIKTGRIKELERRLELPVSSSLTEIYRLIKEAEEEE